MRIHQEEKKYLCPECGYKCKWMSQLKYHMTKHTGTKYESHTIVVIIYNTFRWNSIIKLPFPYPFFLSPSTLRG